MQPPKKIIPILAIFFFWFFTVNAIGIKDFLDTALGITATTADPISVGREENVQTLKVFEADKSLSKVSLDTPGQTLDLDNQNSTLEPGKENFSSDEELKEHNDNAVYTVQRGDSIYSVAAYFGISVETILSYNKKKSKILIQGEVLEVPTVPGVLYEIKKGDTLANISKKYSIDLDDVILYNGLLESDVLSLGDEVFLPGAIEKINPIVKKVLKKNSNLATNSSKNTISDSMLSKYKPKNWARGDTSHLNSMGDIKKFSSLPVYNNFYIYPAPGTSRTQKMHGHNGTDLAGKMGTAIIASAGGTVRVAKYGGYNFGYGNYIIITHSNGTETVYAHLSGVSVSTGQRVSQGQTIGALGSSGNSTGPHLHFEIRGAYNPWAW